MKKPVIYLAGPIFGLTYKEAAEWRDGVINSLQDDFRIITPLHTTELPENFDKENEKLGLEYREIVHSTKEAIYDRDHLYVKSCDILLVNLTQNETSVGTLVEIGMATAWDKYIIIIANPGSNLINHPFTSRRATVVTSLEDAIESLERISMGITW